eukprot:XP_001700946.1 predicted protein [Chlamydomonas reinhardtii]
MQVNEIWLQTNSKAVGEVVRVDGAESARALEARVRELVSYVRRRAAEESGGAAARHAYQSARVVAVRHWVWATGRVWTWLGCCSECDETSYIASRPFRVNAGPVHAYVSAPGGRTRYLSELASGAEVSVADPDGRTRTALVGRVKIERRPLVLPYHPTP